MHQLSSHDKRERRYPVLVVIDLLLHFALLVAAFVLTAIAISMSVNAALPGVARVLGF